jgi:molybdopterin synthase catalytic subunit
MQNVTPEGPFEAPEGDDWLLLTTAALDTAAALEWVERPDCGAGVGFVGNVRDHAEGREGVTAVEYEAYAEQVEARLVELAAAARSRVPALGRIAVWHRTGRLVVGEASVVVAVSAPHRAEAFDGCRFLIDTLKETLPIWKHEHWDEGSGWSPSSRPLRRVEG